jgi:uncharacterized protein
MNRRELLTTGAAALTWGLSGFPLSWAAEASARKRRILMFTRSQGFEHSVVKRKGDELSLSETTVTNLGKKNGFEVVCTKDGKVFDENLDQYHAFFFITTGDLTQLGGDKQPPMSPEGKKAFLQAIAQGKGFIGSHCASDTFHKGDRNKNQEPDQQDPYIRMLGGEFIIHGAQQKAKIHVVDHHFPGMKDVKDFELMEEWYDLKNFAPDLHVILVQETQGMKGNMYHRPNYPETWARLYEKGRVFFTSMGHREDVWENPMFQDILLGGISWALRNVDADVAPNIQKVTPQAMELSEKT